MGGIKSLGEEELLCQLAEEASELSQAALKLRRAINGRNPTPKTIVECRHDLVEEVADVGLVLKYLGLTDPEAVKERCEIMSSKEYRWENRLANRIRDDMLREINKGAF